MVRDSRKALSPLLAIIIGLIVTIVAGILLAQLYFSYAATISTRPSANIEYLDLIADTTDVLVINVKNTGNVPIDTTETKNSNNWCAAGIDVKGSGDPGDVISITCSGDLGVSPGDLYTGFLAINFTDGSSQVYAFAVRARSA